jgi:2-oxoglutarate dehydrogenase E1 component
VGGLALPDGDERRGDTSVPLQKLQDLGRKITAIPERLDVHKNVKRVIENRRAAIEAGEGLDWATGEHMAFATLLTKAFRCGWPVRTASAAPSPSAIPT